MPTPLAWKSPIFSFRPQCCAIYASSIIALWLVLSFSIGTAPAATDEIINSTSSSILALDSARHSAVKELENTSLSANEVSDYKDFIAYLNTQISNYCRELDQLGALAALVELPCPSAAGPSSSQSDGGTTQEVVSVAAAEMADSQTEAEKTSELQEQFLRALGDFDDMLLKEEEQIANRIPSQRETGLTDRQGTPADSAATGRPGDAGQEESATTREQENKDKVGKVSMETQTGSASTGDQTRPGDGVQAEKDRARAGTPEGRRPPPEDDDIVARQLREAAEKEPDPELKKKLWEEYWKYKGVAPKNG